MDERTRLVEAYRWLRQYGINDSHSGNASLRDGDRMWITPQGAWADTLAVEALVACPLAGGPVPGASRDQALHRAVYRANPRARAVMHGHVPHAVALTLAGGDYRPPDLEGQYYFPVVPVLRIAYGDYFEESPARVARRLADHPVVIVAGHGAYAWGESVEQAYQWLCSLELSARTAWLARLAGTLEAG